MGQTGLRRGKALIVEQIRPLQHSTEGLPLLVIPHRDGDPTVLTGSWVGAVGCHRRVAVANPLLHPAVRLPSDHPLSLESSQLLRGETELIDVDLAIMLADQRRATAIRERGGAE